MKEKTKKNLLQLIVLAAIASAIVSVVVPIYTLDYSDIWTKQGYEKPDVYGKLEASIIIWHYTAYDNRDPDSPSEFHDYIIMNIYSFKIGEPFGIISSEHAERVYISKLSSLSNLASMFYIVYEVIGFSLIIFFCIKGIKTLNIKKTKYFLYLSIFIFISSVCFTLGSYYFFGVVDVDNFGYTNFITFGYGFYTGIISIILFLSAFFIQNYFIDYPDKFEKIDELKD